MLKQKDIVLKSNAPGTTVMSVSRDSSGPRAVARRTVLRVLIAAGPLVFGFLPRLGWTKAMPSGKQDVLATASLNMLSDGEAARAVGRAYLAEYPSEGRQSILAGLQGLTTMAGVARGATRRAVLLAELQRAGRRDFAAGNIVEVDGWILSRTEARICALAATD